MTSLSALLQRLHHVVAQVIEAELIVGAVRDVAFVSGPALERPRLGIVDTPDGKTEVRVDVPHPLRVAAGEIGVDRDQVRAVARQGVEIKRKRRDERLSLAGRHFCDAPLVQLDATHQLHVVRHHVPLHLLAGNHHLGSDQPARCLTSCCERLGKKLVQHSCNRGTKLGFRASAAIDAAQLVVDLLTSGGIGGDAFLLPELRDARLDLARALPDAGAELLRLGAELFLGDGLEAGIMLVDLVDDRLNALALPIVASSEHTAQQPC